jgi:hypothetical protein
MNIVVLIFMLLVPGMDKPVVERQQMESVEACLTKVAEMLAEPAKHEGEEFKFIVGCEVMGTKATKS